MTDRMTVRHLLVPVDFSDCSTAAVDYAAFLARRLDARVTLLHALELPSQICALPTGTLPRAGQDESERLARNGLEELHGAYLQGVRTHARVVGPGNAAGAILGVARSAASDMIVMGTRGRGRIANALLGSVASEVIRRSDQPVLTVRRSESAAGPIERILCPVNYSAAAAKAFRQALFFASALDAELLALYFEEGEASDGDVESELERMRGWIGDVPLSVRLTCIARRGEPGSQVSAFAQAHGIDLIVLGAQRTRLGAMGTIGSTTDTLTRHARCPVLTVPATEVIRPVALEHAQAAKDVGP